MNYLLQTAVVLAFVAPASALDGVVQMHDPSTIIQCAGKYYTYGTGLPCLTSDDGWTWHRGASPGGGGGRGGMAPDVIRVGDRYFFYYANGPAQPKAEIRLLTNKSLDTNSPDYKWEDGGIVASSDGVEDCNAIDPGVLLDPNDGRLWLTYGSYFGYIRLVELDPKTGKRLHPDQAPVNLAINCEASIMIYHDGWYYLLATHGSCCAGTSSGYNIRMGRARKVTGPFLDHVGVTLLQGGGKLFLGSSGRFVGPGHFGLFDQGEGVQFFSCHYEADLDRGGASVVEIRPLLWQEGWPLAGENFKAGTYQIESAQTGTALELAVQGVPVGGARARRGGGGGGGFMGGLGGPGGTNRPPGSSLGGAGRTNNAAVGLGGGMFAGQGGVIPPQDVAQVSTNWPGGNIPVRLANYLDQAQQKWTVSAVTNAGGYLGSPYFKITVAQTDRTLAATDDGELVTLPAFTGGGEQLWRIEQLTDGSWRILPKAAVGVSQGLALSGIGGSTVTLARFNPESQKQRWIIKAP